MLDDQAEELKPLLKEFMSTVDTDVIGTNFNEGKNNGVDNREIIEVNKIIRSHPVEKIGAVLRQAMTEMKAVQTVAKEENLPAGLAGKKAFQLEEA